MGCLFVILALMVPRVAMLLMFFLTRWFEIVFTNWLWPVLGFVFLPYTTLAYMAAILNTGGTLTPGWLVLIIVAIMADMAHWGGGYRTHRRRVVVVKE